LEAIFKRAGVSLDDARNIVNDLAWHGGAHPEAYHQEVYKRLEDAVTGKQGKEYRQAFLAELVNLKREIQTKATKLHQLLLY
jgi:hypothetical protein